MYKFGTLIYIHTRDGFVLSLLSELIRYPGFVEDRIHITRGLRMTRLRPLSQYVYSFFFDFFILHSFESKRRERENIASKATHAWHTYRKIRSSVLDVMNVSISAVMGEPVAYARNLPSNQFPRIHDPNGDNEKYDSLFSFCTNNISLFHKLSELILFILVLFFISSRWPWFIRSFVRTPRCESASY